MCVCVCVCERERERKIGTHTLRHTHTQNKTYQDPFHGFGLCGDLGSSFDIVDITTVKQNLKKNCANYSIKVETKMTSRYKITLIINVCYSLLKTKQFEVITNCLNIFHKFWLYFW